MRHLCSRPLPIRVIRVIRGSLSGGRGKRETTNHTNDTNGGKSPPAAGRATSRQRPGVRGAAPLFLAPATPTRPANTQASPSPTSSTSPPPRPTQLPPPFARLHEDRRSGDRSPSLPNRTGRSPASNVVHNIWCVMWSPGLCGVEAGKPRFYWSCHVPNTT
jgi:hypothetical protein